MKKNYALITGLGAISAAGCNIAETLNSFRLEKRNAGQVTLFDTPLKYPVFEVKSIPDEFYLEGQRTLSLALCAVDEALKDAKIDNLSKFRVGVCLGTTVASQLNDLEFYKSYRNSGSAPMAAVDRYLKRNLAEFISRKIKAKGPSLTVVNACSSGTDAIGVALTWLNNDLCDIAVAGGADELSRIPLCGFGSLGIVSSELCAPFDRDRKGLNLGEGAGVLVLETKGSAQHRGISSELYLAGYGSSSDAYHLTSPHPEGAGLKTSIKKALTDACVEPQEISFVNAHGTATPENDSVEGKVLAGIFGTDLKMLSTKGFTGHTLGAAGGLEAVFTASALREGWIPASIGFKNKDGAIPLTPVRERTVINGRYAVSTSLAFGGNNAAIVIGKV
ncbi:MAG: beta-ketoacyl-[acyl-carrier-protein] synthase family protein [Thermodesulfovibrionia bacterium]|nr:beta-ketoacyl-[acyl-carrier-protein] synthase family protein [Thermodesulfovibrionia bacterium]